jgi:ubiquinone/menaquinone biosynthesis C-methylase UbiE
MSNATTGTATVRAEVGRDLDSLREVVFGDPVHGPGARHALSLIGPLEGAAVADMACGVGEASVMFALAGASRVAGVDLNGERIESARVLARQCGVDGRCSFARGSVERTDLEAESFDVVFSKGVLQYVDRPRALTEYMRVLKPGGTLILIENLPHNPFVQLNRFLRRTRPRTPDERAYMGSIRGYVTRREFDEIAGAFDSVDRRFFHLLSAPMAGLRYGTGIWRPSRLESAAARIDAAVLSAVPLSRRLAWIATAVHRGKHTGSHRY